MDQLIILVELLFLTRTGEEADKDADDEAGGKVGRYISGVSSKCTTNRRDSATTLPSTHATKKAREVSHHVKRAVRVEAHAATVLARLQ